MKIVKQSIFLLILVICTMNLSAKSISIVSCQKSTETDSILEAVTQIETGIMNKLFDSGHIVTSEEPYIFDNMKNDFQNILKKYNTNNSIQYVVYIEYNFETTQEANTTTASYNTLATINWNLIKTSTNESLIQKRQNINSLIKNIDNNRQECENLGLEIGMQINTAIISD